MAGAKLLILKGVVYRHTQAAAVPEVRAHAFGPVSYHQDETIHACCMSPEDDMLQQRLAGYGQHHLGHLRGQGTHAASLARG